MDAFPFSPQPRTLNERAHELEPMRQELFAQLIKGEKPSITLIPVDDAASVLSCSAGGIEDSEVKQRASGLLELWASHGLFKIAPTGEQRPQLNTLALGVMSPGAGTRWGSPPVTTRAIMGLEIADLALLKDKLSAEGCWSPLADVLIGHQDSVTATGEERTRMLFQQFKTWAGGKYNGETTLDNLHKYRKRGKLPLQSAFNEDGTVNAPEFERIAKSQGEWNDGQTAIQSAWAGQVHTLR